MIELTELGRYELHIEEETKADTPNGPITLIPGLYTIVIDYRKVGGRFCGVVEVKRII